MEMIEIDPKLFVTCRLCLDNLGVYQIVPSIQQQIKFCYDIEVDPFDGLPQLICKNCESTLRKYAEVKNTYVNKQRKLRGTSESKNVKSLSTAIQPEQDTVSSTQQLGSERKAKKGTKETINNADKALEINNVSISDDKSDTDTSIQNIVKCKRSYKHINKITSEFLDTNYERWFVCRFCDKCCKSKSGITKHINTHSYLLSKYLTCIKRECYVKLNKIDTKPNICKSERIVVHSWDRFVNSENNYYYTVFRPKQLLGNKNEDRNLLSQFEEPPKLDASHISSESSDNELVVKSSKKKRRRILSRSSNETVVVENNYLKDSINPDAESTTTENITSKCNVSKPNDNECISIDDSSDTQSSKSNDNTKNDINTDLLVSLRNTESKTIQNIISVCFKKYLKKIESIENETSHITQHTQDKLDSSLKHKILSIGRKVINNPGFSCIGILRYLEHQNLEVVWIPRHQTNTSKKSEYVRIMIKLRNHEDNDARDFGWEVLEDIDHGTDNPEVLCANPIKKQAAKVNLTQNTEAPPNNIIVCDWSPSDNPENDGESLADRAILYTGKMCSEKDILLQKLLNANPVANPKQLPKKNNLNEIYDNAVSSWKKVNKETTEHDQSVLDIQALQTTADISHLPVITSTISLATVKLNDPEKQIAVENVILPCGSSSGMAQQCRDTRMVITGSNNAVVKAQQDSDKNLPRIKVKPVSELMPERPFRSIYQQENNMVCGQSKNMANDVFVTTVAIPRSDNSNVLHDEVPQIISETTSGLSMSVSSLYNDPEIVLMDSVDLPYTRTDSPFLYLKKLLQIHGIALLFASEPMSLDFTCLLRFKLMFHQESSLSVVLCSTLLYSKKQFCLKVKDLEQKDIDVSRISANWQWEILKVYRGDVAVKLHQNAQRISSDVADNVHMFICLLNTIKLQRLP